MAPQLRLLCTVCALIKILAVDACLYNYGESYQTYNYRHLGRDWGGNCKEGSMQSPVNLVRSSGWDPVPTHVAMNYSRLLSGEVQYQELRVVTTATMIQVEWSSQAARPRFTVYGPPGAKVVEVGKYGQDTSAWVPLEVLVSQLHFHLPGEHLWDGMSPAMEMHLVGWVNSTQLRGCTRMQRGCAVVIAVPFQIGGEDHPELVRVLKAIKDNVTATVHPLQSLNLTSLLPANQSYVSYMGSMSAPPCQEPVLWHVLMQPLHVSSEQVLAMRQLLGGELCTEGYSGLECFPLALGSNARLVQPLHHHRHLYVFIDGAYPGVAHNESGTAPAPSPLPVSSHGNVSVIARKKGITRPYSIVGGASVRNDSNWRTVKPPKVVFTREAHITVIVGGILGGLIMGVLMLGAFLEFFPPKPKPPQKKA